MPRFFLPHLVLSLLIIGAGVARVTTYPDHTRVHLVIVAALLVASLVLAWRYMRSR
jgi:membrane protein implicated in regulation of membrane protease activity